jgi:hypothetical protein
MCTEVSVNHDFRECMCELDLKQIVPRLQVSTLRPESKCNKSLSDNRSRKTVASTPASRVLCLPRYQIRDTR